jgi:hypothetical protein
MTLARYTAYWGARSSVFTSRQSVLSWWPLRRVEGVAMMRGAASADDRETVERVAQPQSALTVLGEWCDVDVAARVAPTREDGERCDHTIELRGRQVLKNRAATPISNYGRRAWRCRRPWGYSRFC